MYKIKIVRTVTEDYFKGKEWEPRIKRPITAEEYDKTEYYKKDKYDDLLAQGTIPYITEWEYAPEVITKREKEYVVLEQTLEEVDIQAVIKAINGIK